MYYSLSVYGHYKVFDCLFGVCCGAFLSALKKDVTERLATVDFQSINKINSLYVDVELTLITIYLFSAVQSNDNSRCTMSPASAFAIATAAAGHSTPQGQNSKVKVKEVVLLSTTLDKIERPLYMGFNID